MLFLLVLRLQTTNGTDAVGGEFTIVAGSLASVPLAYNASASDVAEAVNGIDSWEGLVLAEREELSGSEGDMFEWRLTFSPAEGNAPELRVSSSSPKYVISSPTRCCLYCSSE